LREAAFGNTSNARRLASQALTLLPNNQAVEAESALALSLVGENDRSLSLAQDLNHRFPLDTQLQTLWLPTIRSAVALHKSDSSATALNEVSGTAPMDLASIQFFTNVSCLNSVYLRGQAYLADGNGEAAASEFQKIIDHSGIVWNCWTGALAHLGVARANTQRARTSPNTDAARTRASAAYRDFLSLWKDADLDIPILKEAKAEYAKLQ
jgi:eukaryotic-like serine/threonine-protein kinase